MFLVAKILKVYFQGPRTLLPPVAADNRDHQWFSQTSMHPHLWPPGSGCHLQVSFRCTRKRGTCVCYSYYLDFVIVDNKIQKTSLNSEPTTSEAFAKLDCGCCWEENQQLWPSCARVEQHADKRGVCAEAMQNVWIMNWSHKRLMLQ